MRERQQRRTTDGAATENESVESGHGRYGEMLVPVGRNRIAAWARRLSMLLLHHREVDRRLADLLAQRIDDRQLQRVLADVDPFGNR